MNHPNKTLVCGAGGFIGWHLVNSLKQQGCYVIGVDIKYPKFAPTLADEFYIRDLRNVSEVEDLFAHGFDCVYQLAADMGGAGYIFDSRYESTILMNSSNINLNIAQAIIKYRVPNLFFSSSACVYPRHLQTELDNGRLREIDAYPANPDSEYGWEKLFAERLYLALSRNHAVHIRIARLHNVFGPMGTWQGGREKAPAAICRKIAENSDGSIEVWGDGKQTRSFLYIDDCIDGIHRIMSHAQTEIYNLGSAIQISIDQLVEKVSKISGKSVTVKHAPGFLGVHNRSSDNSYIEQCLGWQPPDSLDKGLKITYDWIEQQVKKKDDKNHMISTTA